MNETQERYNRVLAALEAAEADATEDSDEDTGGEAEAARVSGGLNPLGVGTATYSTDDLIRQYRSGAGSPYRGTITKRSDR